MARGVPAPPLDKVRGAFACQSACVEEEEEEEERGRRRGVEMVPAF